MVHVVTDLNWDEVVTHTEPTVVKFWATWCPPCKPFAPEFEKASEQSDVKFVSAEVEKNEVAVGKYGIRSIPTVLYFNGEEVEVLRGRTADELLDEL